MTAKIRYNTLASDADVLRWRVIVTDDNQSETEYLVKNVKIEVPTYTTEDYVCDSIRDSVVRKFHISCDFNSFVIEDYVITLT